MGYCTLKMGQSIRIIYFSRNQPFWQVCHTLPECHSDLLFLPNLLLCFLFFTLHLLPNLFPALPSAPLSVVGPACSPQQFVVCHTLRMHM